MIRLLPILILSLFLSGETFAYTAAEGKVTAIIGPFSERTDFHGSDSGARSRFMTGTGLIANGDVNEKGSLEIAMFYMPKTFFREDAGLFIAEQAQLIHITMGYRWWLSSAFSFSTAFFSSYTIGDPEVVFSDFAPSQQQQIDTSARDITEYGFDFSTQAELWSSGRYALVLDVRYSLAVTAKPHESENHYGALLGLKYLIQEKEK